MIASWSGYDVRSPAAYVDRSGICLFLGGSITINGSATTAYQGFAETTMRYCGRHLWPALSYDNQGISGNGSWNHLFRLTTDVVAKSPKYIVLDGCANDGLSAPIEAMIRRLRVDLPAARLGAIFWNTDPAREWWVNLCTLYGIPWCDPYAVAMARIAGGEPLTNYYLALGNIHPNDGGHALGAELLEPILLSLVSDYPVQWTGDIADYTRIYDNGDYENTPQIVTAGSLTKTGTWTDSGTDRISTDSATPASLSFTGTFQSFAWWTKMSTGQGTYAWRVDGGSWTNVNAAASTMVDVMRWNGSRAEHTAEIKVISGSIQCYGIKAI